ncbi:hypothetical protein AB691_0771 [Stutzerimonas stutzeri]|nr:hypothetical protein AB691_0771 [Stutzerimonas stutzeri]
MLCQLGIREAGLEPIVDQLQLKEIWDWLQVVHQPSYTTIII